MRIENQKSWTALTVIALIVGSGTAVRADEPTNVGIVRISDQPTGEPETSALLPGGELGTYYEDTYPGCEECGNGKHPSYSPLHFFLTNHSGASHAPDHGWRRPSATPIRRIPVEYRRYWPAKWYGEPGSGLPPGTLRYPMVYTPTDTTQLGFYYQRVPTWQPNPAMIPPKPWPAHWHRREVCAPCCDGEYVSDGVIWGGAIEVGSPEPVPAHGADAAEEAPPPPPVPDEDDKSAGNWMLQPVGN